MEFSTSLTDAYDMQGSCYLDAIHIADKGVGASQIDGLVFNSDPSNTTFTDNSSLDIDDEDLPEISGSFKIFSSDYITMNDNSFASVTQLCIPLFVDTNESFYISLIERGTPTRAVGDLTVTASLLFYGLER